MGEPGLGGRTRRVCSCRSGCRTLRPGGHPCRCSRRTSNFSCRLPLPDHSAHLGQTVEVFYRWHPLFGHRVKRQYSENRVRGPCVHVEVEPGVVIAVAAWMLGPVACAGMELGVPRATLSALADLHRLLIERGFRASSPDDPGIVQEKQNANRCKTSRAETVAALDSRAPALPGLQFHPASGHEPRREGQGCSATIWMRRARQSG